MPSRNDSEWRVAIDGWFFLEGGAPALPRNFATLKGSAFALLSEFSSG